VAPIWSDIGGNDLLILGTPGTATGLSITTTGINSQSPGAFDWAQLLHTYALTIIIILTMAYLIWNCNAPRAISVPLASVDWNANIQQSDGALYGSEPTYSNIHNSLTADYTECYMYSGVIKMGHGFLGMERDPWPPAIAASDSDPVVPPKRKNLLLWLIPRVVIGVFLVLVAFAVYAHFATVATSNMGTFGVRHSIPMPPVAIEQRS